ncbi:hypothetical protein LCGC14_0887420 [marine sediment metagenome]|uniref:Uncharacterized protein n=1 Tax=marine sediment metagenome TaxID=412755 RepID=A0A0F9PKX5_9ZZZZ
MVSFEILENTSRVKIILEFFKSKETLNFDYIKNLVANDTNRPDYHLSLLVENGFIKRIKGRGNYRLNEVNLQPLRTKLINKNILEKVPICLIGGLGIVELYRDILNVLITNHSITPQKYLLITSKEYKKKFDDFYKNLNTNTLKIAHFFEIVQDDLFKEKFREDYYGIYEKFEQVIIENIYDYEIICEITGSTKLISIALMKLSEKYKLPKIYFSSEKIIWL